MVYVDTLMPCMPNHRWKWSKSAHLYAETLEELHAFALRLGLKRAWFSDRHGRGLSHYDVTEGKRRRAVALGAIEQTLKQTGVRSLALLRAHELKGREAPMLEIEVGDIVQVDPEKHDTFGACLVVVSEVKLWGVQGYVKVPARGEAYIRLNTDDFVKVGKAKWVVGASDAEA